MCKCDATDLYNHDQILSLMMIMSLTRVQTSSVSLQKTL